jgi:hypothetical protein
MTTVVSYDLELRNHRYSAASRGGTTGLKALVQKSVSYESPWIGLMSSPSVLRQ